jgi:predicted transcriptional regulator
MTALTIRLPTSVHRRVKELALREEISLNQFIASAVAEKMASVLTSDYLKAEAAQGRRANFEPSLSMVPEVPVYEADR